MTVSKKFDVTCPKCGENDTSPVPVEAGMFLCSECHAVVTFGVLMPRVVVAPDPADARFQVWTFEQDGETRTYRLEKNYAHALVANVKSV